MATDEAVSIRCEDGKEYLVEVRRRKRARRLILRMDERRLRPCVSAPLFTSEKIIRQFLVREQAWIEAEITRLKDFGTVSDGCHLPYDGRLVQMKFTGQKTRRVHFEGNQLMIAGPKDLAISRLERFLRAQAKEELSKLSHCYADRLGVEVAKIAIGDMRTRWGSATSRGHLKYSFRLIMAPKSVQAYVAAHEVSHLLEMNHSKAFWDIVSGLVSEWQQERCWLRTNGRELHAYRFKDSFL